MDVATRKKTGTESLSPMKKIPTDIYNLLTNAWMTPIMKQVEEGKLQDDKYETGNIMNLFYRDMNRVYSGLTVIKNAMYPIVLILLNFVFLHQLIGIPAIISGIFYFLFLIPVIILEVKNVAYNTESNILQDKKANLLRELFKNIKKVKFSNIEDYFSKRVIKNVTDDIKVGAKTYFISRMKLTLTQSLTTVLSCMTYIIYSFLGNAITPSVVFPTYLYLDAISYQLSSLKNVFANVLNIYEGYQLMSDYLLAEEFVDVTQKSEDSEVALQMKNVTWKWHDAKYIKELHSQYITQLRYIIKTKQEALDCKENENTFELQVTDLTIKKGKLIGVVGTVGAGKSTLFAGLKSIPALIEGNVISNGETAYYSQEPWIMTDDIQTNITFGKELDYAKLERIVKACGLVKDLNSLDDGIFSKLGESGINLSGGQKARVALARCMYSDADIYLLDDPLAALDAYVGKQVFERAVKRELAGKTVLLATHQLQYMQQMDEILVLEEGKVAEFGSFDELMKIDDGKLKRMMLNFSVDEGPGIPVAEEELLQPLSQKSKVQEFVKVEKKQEVATNLLNLAWFIAGNDTFQYFSIELLNSVVNAPQYFFEENPLGRILSRFTSDLTVLDHRIFNSIYVSITGFLTFVGKSALVCVASPALIVLLAIAYSIIWHVREVFDTATLEFKRYLSVYSSSFTGLEVETINGVQTITSFTTGQKLFKERFYKFFDKLSGWVAMVQYNNLWYQFRMNSFERVVEYIHDSPQEAPSELPKDPQENTWPSQGSVEIKELTLAYHSKPDKNVINKLSMSIKPGEKVGVVGRTGSGKSTLALAFFRLLEPKSGSIIIDDRDITKMGLKALRSNIQIIAQEANIFPGTIRYNLCLESVFTDEELWQALDMVGMKDYVSQLPDKLDHELIGNASNLSAGQGQLLCLARALVKKPKLLILDEASSSIDGEADKMLQSVLRKTLQDTTIISIAHRLNTIADFDRVLVLDQGEMKEFDAPHVLLQNEESEFTKLVDSSGPSRVALQMKNVTWKWHDAKYIKELHSQYITQLRYIIKTKQEALDCKENENTFELQVTDLTIKKGKLIGVVGTVGAGKSTLFAGLKSIPALIEGNVISNGETAYYSQEPWIMTDDIQTNITFGKELDYAKLERIVKACGLVKDLNSLDDGIFSKLGESGINLSGGQKARVALARCMYSDADIYLLDDPLAALDAYVGKQVFERAVKRELAGKTVLLATHQLQYMQQMDEILVLEEGKVAEFGSFDELMKIDDGKLKRMMLNFSVDEGPGIPVAEEELLQPLSQKSKVQEFVKVEKKQENPLGRILSRFTSDLLVLDHRIYNSIYVSTTGFLTFVGKSVFVCVASPALIVLLAIAYSIIWYVRDIYDTATLEFRRYFSVYYSTFMGIEVETIAGVQTITSFTTGQKLFKERFYKFFDKFSGWVAMVKYNNLWYQFRVSMVNAFICIGVLVGALLTNQHSTLFSALVGLAITQAESCSTQLVLLIINLASGKSQMNSFERVIEYIHDSPQEAPSELPKDPQENTWPSQGSVEVKELTLAYHSKPDKDVINKLSMSIKPGEKVGVVGRTGSGKSTLALAFFRLLEPKSGSITIDDRDITKMGLKALRSNIQIIAQEANIFPGTIRYNLCLESVFTDEELWQALDMVGMKDYVSQQPDKLDHELIGNASNLSAGQGQLLCLARALVKKPKLLILDEASSSIDGEADKMLQSVLRKTLQDTTIISIAHRLNTIADFDRVLVLDQGEMKEFDAPHVLLQNEESEFTRLVDSSGPSNAAAIREMARLKHEINW
ncbi:Multidrug resistance-associated protein 4 [Terramyces sp. JEL0728]|nr:Multidrug resistance-associated protein 4 [Terramyces sp. JEL0728]